MKKAMTFLLLAAFALACVPALAAAVDAAADTTTAAAADAALPTVEKTVYKGFGYVEVDFVQDVNYENPTVSVTDAAGSAVEAVIVSLDDDDLTFQITGFAADADYSFAVSGVRVGRSGAYGDVTGTFTVPPEGAAVIQKVEYDEDDREIDIEFSALTQYEAPSVQVVAADGTVITATVRDWDEDSIDARLDAPLTLGAEYTLTVTGVRASADAQFGTAETSFTAYDD